jgi:alkyl hydroperoxide reductase subunit AhpF
MSLLSPTDQQTLRDSFARMTRRVKIVFFTQTIGCDTCVETRQILDEITALTDKVVVEECNLVLDKERADAFGIDRAPGIALLAGDADEDTRIRFLGEPAGYDFLSLVDAILAASGASEQALSAASLAAVASVTEPITIRVFVTPT